MPAPVASLVFETNDCHINQSATGFTLPDWLVAAVVVFSAAPVSAPVGRNERKFQSTGLTAVLNVAVNDQV